MITSMRIIRSIAENDEVDRELIVKYTEQQEKVNELLELYRSAIKGCPSHVPLGILKDIDKLESELDDKK